MFVGVVFPLAEDAFPSLLLVRRASLLLVRRAWLLLVRRTSDVSFDKTRRAWLATRALRRVGDQSPPSGQGFCFGSSRARCSRSIACCSTASSFRARAPPSFNPGDGAGAAVRPGLAFARPTA